MVKFFVLLLFITFSLQVEGLNFRYIGCYKSFSKGFVTKVVVRSANECWNYCDNSNMAFAALKNTSECYCSNTTDYIFPSFNCNLMCSDNIDTCGGLFFYSVYLAQNFVQPNYIGCYRDAPTRDLTSIYYNDHLMTNDLCFNHCSKLNYTFMATQQYAECFCGNQYGQYGVINISDCKMNCFGNNSQKCGGDWANSVYTACYSFALKKTCSQMFHCDASVIDVNGICPTNKCINGWKGKSCNQIDCSVQNNSCDEYQRDCKEFVIGNETLSECVCKEGYESTSLTIFDDKNCADKDECKLGLCDVASSTCINTIGSYNCVCNEGFIKRSATCTVSSLSQTGTIVSAVMGALLAIALGFIAIFIIYHYFCKSNPSSLTKTTETIQPQTNNENILYNNFENSQTDEHMYSDLTTDSGYNVYNSLPTLRIDKNRCKTLYAPTE